MAIDRPTFGGVNVGNISTGANEFSDKLMDLGFKLNAQDRLKQEDKLREEQIAYARNRDALADKRYDENIARVDAEKNDLKQKEANTAALLFANRDKDAFIADKIAGEKQEAYDSLNNLTGQEAIDTKNQLDAYFAGQGARDSGKQWLGNAQAATNIDAIKVEQALFDQKKLQEEMDQRRAESAQRAREAAASNSIQQQIANLSKTKYEDEKTRLKKEEEEKNIKGAIALNAKTTKTEEVEKTVPLEKEELYDTTKNYVDNFVEKDSGYRSKMKEIDDVKSKMLIEQEKLKGSTYSKANNAKETLNSQEMKDLKLTSPSEYRTKLEEIADSSGVLKGKPGAKYEAGDGSYLYSIDQLENKINNYKPSKTEEVITKRIENLNEINKRKSGELAEYTQDKFNNEIAKTKTFKDKVTTNISSSDAPRAAIDSFFLSQGKIYDPNNQEHRDLVKNNASNISEIATSIGKSLKDVETDNKNLLAKAKESEIKFQRDVVLKKLGIKSGNEKVDTEEFDAFIKYANLDSNKDKSEDEIYLGFSNLKDRGLLK